MPNSIRMLRAVPLDFTNGGPGLHLGMKQLETLLETTNGREGHLVVNVTVPDAVIPVVLSRSDLYVVGFCCGGSWFCFDDAEWPFSEAVTKLGYDGQYQSLGGLTGSVTVGSINGMARLANIVHRPRWKEALRTLIVAVSENLRLIPVRMQITGILNYISPTVPLEPLAHYIQNWDKASKGADMSREVSPNLRVGFGDPTIIKR